MESSTGQDNTSEYTDEVIKRWTPKDLNLYPFQYSGVRFLAERSRALIASDPGTGKTVMCIMAVNVVSKDCAKVLVLCPKSMVLTWKREIAKWANGDEYHVRNWDQIINKKYDKEIFKKWDIIIADESHVAIKNPDAKRCELFVEDLIHRAERVWLATATPASKSGLDYYCTLKVLLPTLVGKWSIWDFKKQFCQEVPDRWAHSGKKYEGFNNTHILKEIFSKCAIRHRKEVVLPDLPEKVYQTIEVEVDESIVAQHLEIDVEYVEQCISDGSPLPGHVAHVMQATAHAKLSDALEWIDNFSDRESLVIFAWHRSVVAKLTKDIAVTMPCGSITGEDSAESRQSTVDAFQRGDLKRLVCNMASGGVGITLTKASTALYIEFPHSPIHLIQSENRIHRIGSDGNKVTLVRMVGKNTIDEAIFASLDKRIKAIGEVGV